MPFMATFGTSMEPELRAGDLILISGVSAPDVKVGDVIVFSVPAAIREYYNYPPIVAHRVIKVNTSEGKLTFRTKGDNTGEDPFTIRPQDLRGQVSRRIPYLGFPLLFLQSQQGLIFIIVAFSLFALFLFADEIGRGRKKLQRGIFSPIIEESQLTRQTLEQRMGNTEKGLDHTQQALNNFASAVAEYAENLRSHTAAIQGLSEASQELKKSAAEQTKVQMRLLEIMAPKLEIMPPKKEEELPPEAEKPKFPPGCLRSRQQHS